MYIYTKGWFVKALREQGVKVHPQNHDHLSKYKLHELRTIYNNLIQK
jgi:hypothetical protein